MEQVLTQTTPKTAARTRGRWISWLALFALVLLAGAMVLVPVWIIMPFKAQTERGMALSYALRSWSPVLTIVALVLGVALTFRLWRGARRWWRKALLVFALLLIGANVWAARQNHFEWMFNPLAHSAYAKAGEADFVEGSDMVLAVELNGEAVAYPIRQMAYHHLVQDRVGGAEIVATY